MSLYYVQKLLYRLNRDPQLQTQFKADPIAVMSNFELTKDEQEAITKPDIGLLYIMGVNGQILMHYAAMCGFAWDEYLDSMRQALKQHGQVRAGIYAALNPDGETT